MKRVLRFSILSLLLFVCGWINAATVVFDVATDKAAEGATAGKWSITKDGITLTCSNGIGGNGTDYRLYKSSTLTVTGTENIKSINLTCQAKGTAKYGPGCFAEQEGYSYDAAVGTWIGDAATVTFTASANQVRATKIEVTYGEGKVIAAPAIEGTESFLEGQEVFVMVVAADGCTLAYTTDGTEPTAANKIDANKTTVSVKETTTIRAISIDADGNVSPIASKTFTMVNPEALTISDCLDLTANKNWVKLMLDDAVVTYVDGHNYFVKQGVDCMMFYSFTGEDVPTFKVGDHISGYLIGDFVYYNGIPELKPNVLTNDFDSEFTVESKGDADYSFNVKVADILAKQYIASYVHIDNVTITSGEVSGKTAYYAEQDGNKIRLYGGDSVVKELAGNGKQYTLYALFNSIYSGDAQLKPVKVVEKTTGIDNVENAGTAEPAAIYNLNGVRMPAAKKGSVNIIGGKKIYVK